MTATPLPVLQSGDPSAWDQALYACSSRKAIGRVPGAPWRATAADGWQRPSGCDAAAHPRPDHAAGNRSRALMPTKARRCVAR